MSIKGFVESEKRRMADLKETLKFLLDKNGGLSSPEIRKIKSQIADIKRALNKALRKGLRE